MRAVVQRVKKARVLIEGKTAGEIGEGLVVLLGVAHDDCEKDVEYLADKIIGLRIFEDCNGKMNISAQEINCSLLIVSQFTLFGDCRKGRRPSYDLAAQPDKAEKLYELFVKRCENHGLKVETGRFRARMLVEIFNDGPVTLLLDSRKLF